jgi:hypothetical protein
MLCLSTEVHFGPNLDRGEHFKCPRLRDTFRFVHKRRVTNQGNIPFIECLYDIGILLLSLAVRSWTHLMDKPGRCSCLTYAVYPGAAPRVVAAEVVTSGEDVGNGEVGTTETLKGMNGRQAQTTESK